MLTIDLTDYRSHSSTSVSGVEWIHKAGELARSGTAHLCLLTAVVVLTINSYHTVPNTGCRSLHPASRPFEVCSQLLRFASLVFISTGALQLGGGRGIPDVLVVAAAFVIGLLRLSARPKWRRVGLHQVNLLTTGALGLLLASEVLPGLDLTAPYRPNHMILLATISTAAAAVVAVLTPREWTPPSHHPDFQRFFRQQQQAQRHTACTTAIVTREMPTGPSPEETCSWFSYHVSYDYLTPLVRNGFRQHRQQQQQEQQQEQQEQQQQEPTTLQMDDLPPMPWYDDPRLLFSRIADARRRNSGSTLRTIGLFLRGELRTMACWVACCAVVEMVPPFAMYRLLTHISSPREATLHPALWLGLGFAGAMARTVCLQQYIFMSTRFCVRLKSGLTQELYRTAVGSLELEEDVLGDLLLRGAGGKGGKWEKGAKTKKAGEADKSSSAGRLANLMASDIDAIFQARDVVLTSVGVPISLALSFLGLYRLVGWSALCGLAVLALSIPLPVRTARLMAGSQRGARLVQDGRISLVSEYVSSIRLVKYFAWEDALAGVVGRVRAREQGRLWEVAVLSALTGQVAEFIPVLSVLAIFSAHVCVRGGELTAAVAFTTLSLTFVLRLNMLSLGAVSRNLTSAGVSIERLDRYFNSSRPLQEFPDGPLRIGGGPGSAPAVFRRGRFLLRDVSIGAGDVAEGGLTVVTGRSGCGKTTLLLSVLGETALVNAGDARVSRPEGASFASQSPWLLNATIRQNIFFYGDEHDEGWYRRVVRACCLQPDLDQLRDGDGTTVGENGVALSGGQRARVALARAIYSSGEGSLLLLDDVFAALDSRTTASVWKECFCSDLLRGRTVILVTQLPHIIAQADVLIRMGGGRITQVERRRRVDGDAGNPPARAPFVAKVENDLEEQAAVVEGSGGQSSSKPGIKRDDIANEMQAFHGTGRMLVFEYMANFGSRLYPIFALASNIMSNVAYVATSLWLAMWVGAYDEKKDQNPGKEPTVVSTPFYLGVYVALSLLEAVVNTGVALIYAGGTWNAARALHARLTRAVLDAPLSWHERVPSGRVVNRFSRDMDSLDTGITKSLVSVSRHATQLAFRIAAVGSVLPVFVLPAGVCCLLGALAGEAFTRAAVLTRRLKSSSQSPLFSLFADTLSGGLPVIRATRRGRPGVFAELLAERMADHTRALEASYNINRWVSVRIDFAAALIALGAGIIAVEKASVLPTAIVAFSLSNATGLGEIILRMVRSSNELEVELQSYGRIKEYINVPPEDEGEGSVTEAEDEHHQLLAPGWPRTGAVEFRNVTVKYKPNGDDILTGVNLKFEPGERVAIVGRTGAGKTTLLLSLLRLTHVAEGQILYDGVDISTVPRRRLRERLTVIPQEAVLFAGTVRSNLDPAGDVPDEMLRNALAECGDLASFSSRRGDAEEEGEEDEVEEGGEGGDSVFVSATSLLTSGGDGAKPATPTASSPLLLHPPSESPGTLTPCSSSNLSVYGSTTTAASKLRSSDSNNNGNDNSSGVGLNLSTAVEPRGQNFSHGQRQVLSLCRALVRAGSSPLGAGKLMLLDEATASMDRETDGLIQSVLRRDLLSSPSSSSNSGRGTRTLVTIAHRLSTVADYDKVVVMKDGKVIEVGSPPELLRAGGEFAEMVRCAGEGEAFAAMVVT